MNINLNKKILTGRKTYFQKTYDIPVHIINIKNKTFPENYQIVIIK